MRSLFRYLDTRNKLCVYRRLGGLGDILMHRMLFEDIKKQWPDCQLTFSCPKHLHEAVIDHPFIDYSEMKLEDYIEVFDTSHACYRREIAEAPNCTIHRSDIWAEKIGIKLNSHNMNIVISEKEKKWAKSLPDNLVLISPLTAMSSKNLAPDQLVPIKDNLEKLGYNVFFLHNKDLIDFGQTLHDLTIRQMMAATNHAKLTIAADTAAFHLAGGLGKNVVGIFGWADGKVYSKYYKNSVIVQRHRDNDPDWKCGPCFKFHSCTQCDIHQLRKPCITTLGWENIWEGVKVFL